MAASLLAAAGASAETAPMARMAADAANTPGQCALELTADRTWWMTNAGPWVSLGGRLGRDRADGWAQFDVVLTSDMPGRPDDVAVQWANSLEPLGRGRRERGLVDGYRYRIEGPLAEALQARLLAGGDVVVVMTRGGGARVQLPMRLAEPGRGQELLARCLAGR